MIQMHEFVRFLCKRMHLECTGMIAIKTNNQKEISDEKDWTFHDHDMHWFTLFFLQFTGE